MKRILQSLMLFMSILLSQAFAQERVITGTVTDQADGTPLPGVSVVIKGTKTGTQTNADGKFSITLPRGQESLTFSYIGYTAQTVAVKGSILNVELGGDAKQLGEVIVTGYGTQSRRDVTGSVASVSGEKLRNQPVQSFEQALQGKATGVSVIQPNGVLNNPPVFRVRGFNSISLGSYPLIVVDGLPVFTGDQSQTNAPSNPLGDINPEDIQSIDILKDAASTAIYGSRAANGVVVITTKKGTQGKVKVNYDGWVGISNTQRLPELLNAEQYVTLKNEARTNAGQSQAFALQKLDDGSTLNTDWYDFAYRTGVSQNHNLNFAGASSSTSYYISVGYTDQQGIIRKNDYKRMIGRANLDHNITDKIKVGTNFNFSNSFNQAPSTGSLPGQAFNTGGLGRLAIVLPPNVAAYNADGSYNVSGSAIGYGANSSAVAPSYPNAAVLVNEDKFTSENNNLIATLYGQYEILKGLTFKTNYGLNNLNVESIGFNNRINGDGYASNGISTNGTVKSKRWDWFNTLSYNGTIGKDHSINAYVGYEEQHTSVDGWGAQRSNVIDPFIDVFQGSYGTIVPANLVQGENSFRSFFTNLNYDYKKRYFISGSFRRDGLSALAEGNKYGNFGGASAGWAISEENFFKNSGISKLVSMLKIRGSFGKVGNAGLSDFAALYLYNPGLYGTSAALAFNQAGNPNLKWETSKKYDGGLTIGFLDGRINFDADYYRNNIDGLILNSPQSPSKGIPNNSIAANIGSMYNQGFEFSVNSTNIRKGSFTWSSTLSFSTNKNRVTALANNNADLFGPSGLETANITRVGYSLGSIFTVPTAGVDPATGERIFINRNGDKVRFSFARPTASRWLYLEGANAGAVAPAIDATLDGKITGNAIPTWYGGFDNNFRYKAFDMNLGITFSGGNKVYYGTLAGLRDQRFWNNEVGMLDRWTTPGQVTDIPKVVYGDNTSNGSALPESQNVFSGDFLKLRNIAFGYSFPKSLLPAKGLSSVRVYAQATNLVIITKYPGPDPEVSVNGNATASGNSGNLAPSVDRNATPSGRVFTFGLNVGF
ncbi:SusC/RagA family TonB-linked outer membrane protein [Pedobacter sp. HMF7647]|uniref:SusC/RagA family TonB-linked outer membrane protein n=1 Tax=Hufsiella arboris TaxID=2695275 RepID=A0A7K1Y5N8_9SPHI|nr:TonB-dependent receptor [Hufsiella arboris]MXV49711.1 SusC/RagA family TonB-linked outer membrane protein [Hufsiella arboris]